MFSLEYWTYISFICVIMITVERWLPTIGTVSYQFFVILFRAVLQIITSFSHALHARTRSERRRQMSCPFLKIFNPASFATKMEAHGIRIVEIDGVSVVTHDGNIINPFSERFTQRYLVNAVGCSSIRKDILSTIINHFRQPLKRSLCAQKCFICRSRYGNSRNQGI